MRLLAVLLLALVVSPVLAQHKILMRDATRGITVQSAATLTPAGAMADATDFSFSGVLKSTDATPGFLLTVGNDPDSGVYFEGSTNKWSLRLDNTPFVTLNDDLTLSLNRGFLTAAGVAARFTGPLFYVSTVVTIDVGSINASRPFHEVDTEAAAASDDLVTIGGGSVGQLLRIRPANGSRTVVVKHGVGTNKVLLEHSADFAMDNIEDYLDLFYDASDNQWHEVGRSESSPSYYEVTATATDSMADADYAQIDDMTVTPAAGTYLVSFSSSADMLTLAFDSLYTYAIFEAGSIVQHSERTVTIDIANGAIGNFTATLHSQAVLVLDGTEAVTVQLDANSNNSIEVFERSLILTRLN